MIQKLGCRSKATLFICVKLTSAAKRRFSGKRNNEATEPPTKLAADERSLLTKRIGALATERKSSAAKEVQRGV